MPLVAGIDALILLAFVTLAVRSGLRARKQASQGLEEYFLAGRTLSGWKAGASMAEQGAVSRMFQRKGQIFIDKELTDEETLMELVLEAGAEDLKIEGDQFEVITDPKDFDTVSDAITQADIAMAESAITMIPDVVTEVADVEKAQSIMRFVEALEELDDVQDVYTNFDISDEIAAQLEAE